MNLSTIRNEMSTLERGIQAADSMMDGSLLDQLQERRAATIRLAAHLLPRSREDAIFLHDVIDELTEFVEAEPTRESDKDDAITAILRINENLRAYQRDG